MTKTIEQLYEELRAVIDGGSESMTHEDAVEEVKALKEQNELLLRRVQEEQQA